MGAFESVAVIAAAWLPQVAIVVYVWLIKPKVKLVVSPAPEIGYSTFGPVLNLNCALSTSQKDALIEKITATVRHDRGQTIELTWVTLNETLSFYRTATGEVTGESTRVQPA